jgi:hypothetical protein
MIAENGAKKRAEIGAEGRVEKRAKDGVESRDGGGGLAVIRIAIQNNRCRR